MVNNGRMQLRTFLSSMTAEEREAFASRCESSTGHIANVGYGYKPCGTALAVAIEEFSGGQVMRWELRPLDWWRHWPELKARPDAPAIPEQVGA